MNDQHSATHGHDSHGQADAHGDHGHHTGLALYIYVFFALCVLTGASFFTYSSYWPFHDQPAVGWTFMMAVSCTKAMLVIMFFMHVKYEKSWKYVLTIPTAMMAIFLVLMLVPDIGMRTYHYSEERLKHTPIPTDYDADANADGANADGKAAEGQHGRGH